MPNYKKRRVNKLQGVGKTFKKKKHNIARESEDIVMTPMGNKKKSEGKGKMRVVKGKKLEQRRKFRIFISSVSFVAVVCIVLNFVLPMGLFENVQNLISQIGAGGYPIELDSNQTLNTVSRGSYYYVLTDTRLNAFTNGGKKVFSVAHGYENPIIKTSKTRVMVFNQGATELMIYNLADHKTTLKTKKNIITAAISDSGVYAVATKADNYASAVTVYNKRGKVIYEWFSSADTVNNIAISPNGKKIAVSVFNAEAGKFTSKINVFDYKSANPVYSEKIENSLVYGIDSTLSSRFAVLSNQGVKLIKWSNYKASEYKNDYGLSMFRAGPGGYVAVFNRDSDRSDNRVVVFSAYGKVKGEFNIKGILSDIQISSNHIYCISDTDIYIYNRDGKILWRGKCDFGARNLAVTGSNVVGIISDSNIQKVKLEQVKK